MSKHLMIQITVKESVNQQTRRNHLMAMANQIKIMQHRILKQIQTASNLIVFNMYHLMYFHMNTCQSVIS